MDCLGLCEPPALQGILQMLLQLSLRLGKTQKFPRQTADLHRACPLHPRLHPLLVLESSGCRRVSTECRAEHLAAGLHCSQGSRPDVHMALA